MTTTPDTTAREVLEVARHEAGHALAHWWNGQHIHAIEMRDHEEGVPRVSRRGSEYKEYQRAAVEGPNLIPAPSLLPEGYITMEKSAELDTDLREWVERDLLHVLSGPAVDWRNAKDDGALYDDLGMFLVEKGYDGRCRGDMMQADDLLNLFPEEERDEAWMTACRRAEVLICRYWPELCALADRLITLERLEDEALDAVLTETLGKMPENLANDLSGLEQNIALGDVEAEAYWHRSGVIAWELRVFIDDLPMEPLWKVALVEAEEGESDCGPMEWQPLYRGFVDDVPPATGSLQKFLADLADAKVCEMRRDPDNIERMEADS